MRPDSPGSLSPRTAPPRERPHDDVVLAVVVAAWLGGASASSRGRPSGFERINLGLQTRVETVAARGPRVWLIALRMVR